MGRRKSSKRQKMENRRFTFLVMGILLICFSILGLGFGPVGLAVKKIALFILGEWWFVLLLLLFALGICLLIEKRMPNLANSTFWGVVILGIVVLVISHFYFINNYQPNYIFNVTTGNCKLRANTIKDSAGPLTSGQNSIKIGGGVVGAAFSILLVKLFAKVGTIIVLIVLSLIAIIMIFDIDIGEYLGNGINSLRGRVVDEDDDDDDEEEEEEEEEDDSEEVPSKKSLLGLFGKKNKKEVPVQVVEEIKETVVEEPPVVEPVINKGYVLPKITLLDPPETNNEVTGTKGLIAKGNDLIKVLADFQIPGAKVVATHVGPAVTQYELDLPAGTKVSRLLSINKEIALALAAKDVRIQAPIPGKSTVGIELPNGEISSVKIRGILQSINVNKGIQAALGKDLMGNPRYFDITKMPHLLIAGSTGSGKSVCTNSIIISILMRYKPDEVKLVLVDPKQVELSNYNGIPHLLLPVVTDPKKASATLQRIVVEMDDRYRAFAENQVKKIDDYNALMERKGHKEDKMPYIVVIIDEMADLMLVAKKEVEDSILRITQLARAAGIHLITATQRPSTDIITGIIKANIPSRIAFAVASQVDSRTILDGVGAEKLLGKGDMLFLPMGQNTADRIQGCFVSDAEIERVINACKEQQTAVYDERFQSASNEGPGGASNGIGSGPGGTDDDPLYNEIYEFAMESGKISASLIQRRFRLGYNRAARIIDIMEERGVIGPQNGSKPREVLAGKETSNGEEE